MNINTCYIGYVTKKPEYNINSVNPLYLFISELDGFIDEQNSNKYLNITLTDSNNDVLIKYAEVWNGIKNQIKKINNDSVVEYDKDYIKIKFDSDDNLPLNKVLEFHAVIIIIRSLKTKFKMEVNVKNKKYDYAEKSIIKLNDVGLILINIIRKESTGINIYYINHFYLEDNNIKQGPFCFGINDVYGYFEENNGKNYFNIDNTYNNKKILQKYMLLWDDVKDIIKNKGGKPFSDFVKEFLNLILIIIFL